MRCQYLRWMVSMSLTGVLAAFGSVTRHSADPVVHKQMIAVAQELLEEIQLKPYAVAAHTGSLAQSEFGEGDRVLLAHGHSRRPAPGVRWVRRRAGSLVPGFWRPA